MQTSKKLIDRYPEIFAEIVVEKHPDLDLENITYGSHKKLYWRCRRNSEHIYHTSINARTSKGNACPNAECKRVKSSETCKQIYGCDHPCKNETVKEKRKETWKEIYGCDHPWKNETVKEKRKETCKQIYGCDNPSKNETVKEKRKETWKQIYGCDHPWKNESVRDKRKETFKQIYGCDHPLKNETVKEKMKETCKQIYGCDHPWKNETVKEKRKETCKQIYGCDNPSKNETVKDKMKETWKEIYGCDHPWKNESVKEKRKETFKQIYGCDHPMQNAAIAEKALKSSWRVKEYIFPSGRKVYVQGYEPQALQLLLESGTHENDIEVSRTAVPCIKYKDRTRERRYYPDIFIKSQNHLIEVKGAHTATIDTEIIQAKLDACRAVGFSIQLWLVNKKGSLLQAVNNVDELNPSLLNKPRPFKKVKLT